jgi:hypothetical protein
MTDVMSSSAGRGHPVRLEELMASRSSLRASDADREAIAAQLRQAAVEGRLDADELEERLDGALRARTYGDLDRLVVDLPAKPLAAPRRTVPAVRATAAVAVRVLALLAFLTVIAVGAVLTAAWWMLWVVVWVVLRAHRGGCGHRARYGGPAWHRPPRVRRI